MQPIAWQAVSQLIRYYVDRLPTDVDGGCAGDAYVGDIWAAERAWHRGAKMGRFKDAPGRAIDRVNGVVLRRYVYDVIHTLTCNCLTCHKQRLSVDLIVQRDRSEQLEGRGRNG